MIEHLINQTKLIMYAIAELERCGDYGEDYYTGLQLERVQSELANAVEYLQEVQRIKSERE